MNIDLTNTYILRNFETKFIPILRDYWYQKVPDNTSDIDNLISEILKDYHNYKTIDEIKFKINIFGIAFSYYSQFVQFRYELISYFNGKLVLNPTDTNQIIGNMNFYTKEVDSNLDNWFTIATVNGQKKVEKNTAYIDTQNYFTSTTVFDELKNITDGIIGLITDAALYQLHKPGTVLKRENCLDFYTWSGLDVLINDFSIQIPGKNA